MVKMLWQRLKCFPKTGLNVHDPELHCNDGGYIKLSVCKPRFILAIMFRISLDMANSKISLCRNWKPYQYELPFQVLHNAIDSVGTLLDILVQYVNILSMCHWHLN